MNKIKQVIVIRKDLNMRKGKAIAQGAHASMKVILDRSNDIHGEDLHTEERLVTISMPQEMYDWVTGIFTKVVVYVNSEDELLEVYKNAKDKGVPCSLIEDAGLTEFHGVKTKTAVAVGPDLSVKIDEITGHLKLM